MTYFLMSEKLGGVFVYVLMSKPYDEIITLDVSQYNVMLFIYGIPLRYNTYLDFKKTCTLETINNSSLSCKYTRK